MKRLSDLLKASQPAPGEACSGLKAGSSGRALLSALTHVPRCHAQRWKDLIGPLEVQKQQPVFHYKSVVDIYFCKVLGNCGYVFAGGLMSVIEGKTRFALKT